MGGGRPAPSFQAPRRAQTRPPKLLPAGQFADRHARTWRPCSPRLDPQMMINYGCYFAPKTQAPLQAGGRPASQPASSSGRAGHKCRTYSLARHDET